MKEFLLDGLAAYRVTRLITTDDIAEPVRDFVYDRDWFVAGGIECDWCVGVWVVTAQTLLKRCCPRLYRFVRWPLAIGAAVGFMGQASRAVKEFYE
jgi:hypothetical protein